MCWPFMPSWISFKIYSTRPSSTHFNKGIENPLRYNLPSRTTYVQALCLISAASFLSSGNSPEIRKRKIGVIQLLLSMSQMSRTSGDFSMLGFDNVSWMSDWFPPFFLLVLAILIKRQLLRYVLVERA
ncbi:hypothetical protein A2U01_0051714 [Trifolium medium]|uniref:Uncharacterized protein n=1 Tax=Trifolium medium TaxID=97028 RepID=A0A392R4M8_9FABA|nr:hypothetical protein [Trifolium medium]